MPERRSELHLEILARARATGEPIVDFDFEASAFGPPHAWPHGLLTAVELMHAAPHPILVAWGPRLEVIYNTAAIPVVGLAHPALGTPLAEVWPEAWSILHPMIGRVRAGEPVRFENEPFRGPGALEQTWFTGAFTPLRDHRGEVNGLYASVIETTPRIEAERAARLGRELDERLEALDDEQAIAEAAAEAVLRSLRAGTCRWFTLHSSADGAGPPPAILEDLRAGRRVAISDLSKAGSLQVGGSGSGAALWAPRLQDGALAGVLQVTDPSPRRWRPAELELASQAADRIWNAILQRRAAAALRESETRLRLATEAARIGLWDVDPIAYTLYWPPAVRAMFGIFSDRPVTMAEDFVARLHPQDRDRVTEAYAAAADPQRRAFYDVEYRTIGAEDGLVRWVAAKGRGLFDARGRCVRVLGAAIDITGQRRAAERLERSESALARTVGALDALLANAPIGFGVFDLEGRYVRVNQILADIHQAPIAAHPGRSVEEITPSNAAFLRDAIAQVAASRRPLAAVEIDGETLASPGQIRSWLANLFPVFDESGELLWVGVTLIDITERKRAEQALRQLNEALEARVAEQAAERDRLWRNSQDVHLVLTPQGRLADASPALTRVLGWPQHALNGQDIFDYIHPEDVDVARESLAQAPAHGLPTLELRFRRRDGGFRRISFVGAAADGMIYASGRDVTDARAQAEALARAEEALRQAQKMESLGQLTGGVAHDFNNLLQGLSGSLDLIRRRAEEPVKVRAWADAGLQAVERAARLTSQLLAFSRSQRLELRPVALGALGDNLEELLSRTLGPQVRVRVELDERDLTVLGDEVQLEMALLNLAINARDAMPGGGRLTIAARGRRIVDDPMLEPGDYVEIVVADTGTGMSPDVQARAFEPFFTTKGASKGSGLGLSQVYGMARQAGGGARISSRPGEGTTISLYLRRTSKAPGDPASGVGAHASLPPGARVLVVDDDDDVRRFLVDALETLGCMPLQAADARSALDVLPAARPAAMIIDFAMPEMNGAELARLVRLREPALPIVFASGFADTAALEAAGPGAPTLRKPFVIEELQAVLSTILARPRPSEAAE